MIYCRTHNVSICLYIAYIACGSASLYIKTLYFFLTVLELSATATVTNIKIRYDAKIPQFALFGTHVIYVFYSIIDYPLYRILTCRLGTRSSLSIFVVSLASPTLFKSVKLLPCILSKLKSLFGWVGIFGPEG